MIIAHDGPASELGDEMGSDDLANLWPWFKQKHVTLWPDVEYREVDRGRPQGPTARQALVHPRGQEHHQHAGLGTQHGARRTADAAGGRDPRDRQRPRAGPDGRRRARGRTRRLRRLTGVVRGRRRGMFELLEGAPPYREDDAEDYLRGSWWSGLTFGDLLDRAADIHPNKEAFVDRQNRLTYAAGARDGGAAGHRADGSGHQASRPGDDPVAQLDRVRARLLRLPEDRGHHGDAHRPLPAARDRAVGRDLRRRWPG